MGRQARNRISENEKRRSESKHGVGEAVAVAAGQTVQYAADNYMPSVEDCAEQERQRYAGGDIEPVDSVSFNPYREVPGQNAVQGVIIQDARHDGCCNTELCLSIWGVFCFGLVCAAAVPVASWIISKCHLPDAMRSVCSETRKPGKVETSDKSNQERKSGNEVETSSNSVSALAEPEKVETSDKSNEEGRSGNEVETSGNSVSALYFLIKYYNLAIERLTRAKEIAAKTKEIADKIANSKLLAQFLECGAQIPPKLHHFDVCSEKEEVERYETTDAWISELVGMNRRKENTNPELKSVYSGLEPQKYLMAIMNGEDLEHYTDIADGFGSTDYEVRMLPLDKNVVLQVYRLTLYDTVPFAVLNYTRNIANSQLKVFEAYYNEFFTRYPESVPASDTLQAHLTSHKFEDLKKLVNELPGYLDSRKKLTENLKSRKELTENSSDLWQEGFRRWCVLTDFEPLQDHQCSLLGDEPLLVRLFYSYSGVYRFTIWASVQIVPRNTLFC